MGGMGSGGHNSKGRRTVEGQYRLDASDLKRRGLTRNGSVSHLYWKGSDTAPGPSLKVVGGENAITLSYAWRRGDDLWQKHEERVGLHHHARQFGGCETYFLCPKCARTVKRLYGGGVRYLCRTCHGLVHASTQERPGSRATRKNQKLRRRLGVEIGLGDWIGPKPKGMHRKTFEEISARIHAAESEVYDDMLVLLNRMQRTTERRSARIGVRERPKDFWR
ncbi:hypothetical protein [Hyphomonas sp.]|uniref:hypothetical protein n=1 Tax=Hyphomonas sp. TaxID=87 RepID=UPI0025B994D7|nr:hypothetical protein [Hyphomonas sp.]